MSIVWCSVVGSVDNNITNVGHVSLTFQEAKPCVTLSVYVRSSRVVSRRE